MHQVLKLSNHLLLLSVVFTKPRACLKKAFCELRIQLRIPVCGRFRPNEGGVAGLRQPNKGKIYRKVGLVDRGNGFSNTL